MTSDFNDLKKIIGKNIKKYRKIAQYTQIELGIQANISEDHMGKIERGTKVPKLETLLKIADTLNVKIADLLE